MTERRLRYLDWLVDIGREPAPSDPEADCPAVFGDHGADSPRLAALRSAVQDGLAQLDDNDRELVVQSVILGRSLVELAAAMNRDVHRVEAQQRRALRRLKSLLAPIVRRDFGLETEPDSSCPICQSPRRQEIDAIIAARDRRRPWTPILRTLRVDFALSISTPQVVIGHERYHLSTNEPQETS